MKQALIAACVSLVAPVATATAQVVRGAVVDREGAVAVPGVIVVLTDSAGNDVMRALSNERGEFTLRVPSLGARRLRALRIGYAPTDTVLAPLGPDDIRTVRLVLAGAPIRLRAVEVVAQSACVGRTDPDVLQLWEEARKALIATTLTRSQRSYEVRIATFERWLDRRGAPTRAQALAERAGRSTKPFASVPQATLAVKGYVVPLGGDIIYRAPDAEILASNGFAAAYCLRIAGDSASRPGAARDLLGLGFSPAERRARGIADIAGVLWIHRETAELRALDFRYVGAQEYQEAHAGGRVLFTRLPDGAWLVDRWDIRMPLVTPSHRRGNPPDLNGFLVNGGAILRMQRGSTTIYEGGVPLTGRVRDASGAPVAGARVEVLGAGREAVSDSAGHFAFPMLVGGRHTVHARTALLDSLGAPPIEAVVDVRDGERPHPLELVVPRGQLAVARACRDAKPEDDAGIGVLHGTVRTQQGRPASGAMVRISWQQVSRRSGAEIFFRPVTRETVANADGTYRICGVPRDRNLRVDAAGAGAVGSTIPTTRRIEGNAVLVRHDIILP